MTRRIEQLTVLVTSKCNLNCPYCNQRAWRHRYPNHEMRLNDIERLIRRSREIKVRYRWIHLSGGEPTLWPWYKEAVCLLHKSGVADAVMQISNGMSPDILEPVMDCITRLRLSLYPGVNDTEVKRLRAQYPDKVEIWHERHRRMPQHPISDSLPADCRCQAMGLVNDRFYTCSNAFTNIHHLGLELDDPELSCHIEDDFAEHFLTRKSSRFRHPICQVCLANRAVWKAQRNTELRS